MHKDIKREITEIRQNREETWSLESEFDQQGALES